MDKRSKQAVGKLLHLVVLTAWATSCSYWPIAQLEAIAQTEATSEATQSLARAEQLNEEAYALYQQGQYAEAILLLQEAIAIKEAALGPDHPEVATSLSNLAGLHRQQGNDATALPLYERVLSIRATALGPDHLEVAASLNNLAELHLEQGNYDIAMPLFERSLSIREAALGPNHPAVATSLNNLASLYYQQSNYDVAMPLFERALSIYEVALGPNHPELATSLNNLAKLHYEQGNYDAALSLYARELSIREATLGPDHPDITLSLTSLANSYYKQGNYDTALSLHERALSIRETALGSDHLEVAISLNNLAELHLQQGEYTTALPLHERSLSIREAALGPNHIDVATSLNNLATLYRQQGNYATALPLYERSLSIREAALDPNHIGIAIGLNNLALLYDQQGNPDAALPLYERSLYIYEDALGPNHPDVGTILNNLGSLYVEQENYAAALPLYERSLSISETALGSNHPDVATRLNNLARLYREQGNYDDALQLQERSLSIYEAMFGPNHPTVAISLNSLAVLYYAKGQVSQAINLSNRASAIEETSLASNLRGASETRQQYYANGLEKSTYTVLSGAINEAPTNSEAAQLALTTILRRKGRVLDATASTSQQLRHQLTPENQALLDELNTVRTQLTNLRFSNPNSHPPEQYQTKLNQLEPKAEALEEQLARSSAQFRIESEPVTTAAIQALIPANAALIELVLYEPVDYNNLQSPWGAPRYAAYITTQAGSIQSVDLGEAVVIDQLVSEFLRSLATKSNSVNSIARQLDEKLMAPIRPLVGDKTHLLISPDSQLTLVPFDALVDEQNRYLIETYQTSYLTSGRDLLKLQLDNNSTEAPVIIADPDYAEGLNAQPVTSSTQRSVDAASLSFNPLPGTAAEAEAISPLFPSATLFTGQQATENNLKQIDAPSILHIATHGFFLPDVEFVTPSNPDERAASLDIISTKEPTQITQSNLENPLLRSGLALAGANTRSSDGEDGIFTALEASGLNLYGTQLVVLSACETGLGKASNGEGVYGLRRAFTIAGAQSQLMSLWQIDDLGTSELMTLYYQNLIEKGQGRSESLRNAQLALMETGTYAHPYYWSSFIFSGDWRPVERQNL
ncbi:MAG: tetratricopeptide repeat protein [Cyanobacteria bacterium J06621_11]